MADDSLVINIQARTDEFVKNVEEAKKKVKSLSLKTSEIDKQLKIIAMTSLK